MALTENHVKHVCMLGHPEYECPYLYMANDKNNNNVFVCLKKTVHKKLLDSKMNTLSRRKNKNTQGNCPGYFAFLNIKQGYDVD